VQLPKCERHLDLSQRLACRHKILKLLHRRALLDLARCVARVQRWRGSAVAAVTARGDALARAAGGADGPEAAERGESERGLVEMQAGPLRYVICGPLDGDPLTACWPRTWGARPGISSLAGRNGGGWRGGAQVRRGTQVRRGAQVCRGAQVRRGKGAEIVRSKTVSGAADGSCHGGGGGLDLDFQFSAVLRA
jgi:hypothetical protein